MYGYHIQYPPLYSPNQTNSFSLPHLHIQYQFLQIPSNYKIASTTTTQIVCILIMSRILPYSRFIHKKLKKKLGKINRHEKSQTLTNDERKESSMRDVCGWNFMHF